MVLDSNKLLAYAYILLLFSAHHSSQMPHAQPVPLFYHFTLGFILLLGFVYIDVLLNFSEPLSGLSGRGGKFICYCNLIDDVCDDRRKHFYASPWFEF